MGFFISKCPTFTAIMHSALDSLIKGNSISFNGTKGYDLGNNPKKVSLRGKEEENLPEASRSVINCKEITEGLKKTV